MTATDHFMKRRKSACIAGDHVKRKWVKTGEDSARLDHEPTSRKDECIFCKYMDLGEAD